MHAPISAVFSLFSFYHVFSFSLSVLFCSQFLTIFFLWVLLPLGKASPTIFGLLWASLQECPPTHWLSDHYHYQVNSIHSLSFTTHSMTKSLFVCSCCIRIFGKIPFQQGIFPKEATAKNQIQTPFSSYHQTTPSESLDRGSTSLVLAMYRLVVLRSLCAYATIFCFCLLLFPRRFCCSKLVLFCPAACLFYTCLSSIKEGTCSWACLVFFCLFSNFVFFLIHTFPVADTFCYSLFLFIMFIHIRSHSYRFIQKDLGLCGPNSVYWIKGYQTQLVLFCQSHSTKELYSTTNLYSTTDHFPSISFIAQA